MDNDQRDKLIQALVESKHRQRYMMNAWFNNSVNSIVAMLPAWIDGLAAESDLLQANHDLALMRLRNMTITEAMHSVDDLHA